MNLSFHDNSGHKRFSTYIRHKWDCAVSCFIYAMLQTDSFFGFKGITLFEGALCACRNFFNIIRLLVDCLGSSD